MKRIALITLLAANAALLFSQNADGIVRASRDRIKSESISTRSRMVITAKDGTTTERLVDQYAVDSAAGTKTLIVFKKPASVAGTRFLTIENPGKTDDRWIFLPALGKVRRISSGEGSGSFMGSDFSYDDVSSADRGVDEDTHTLLREETVDGKACWVIEAKPKDPGYQYSRMVSWIEKDRSIGRKIEMFDKKGNLLKTLELGNIEDIQGRLTPRTTRMVNVQTKTSTTIEVEIMKYDDVIPEGVFTTRYLETGRP